MIYDDICIYTYYTQYVKDVLYDTCTLCHGAWFTKAWFEMCGGFLRWELTNTVHFTMGKPWLWATTISGSSHITNDIQWHPIRCAWNLLKPETCQEESDWRNDWNEWKKDDWWNGWSGWHDRSWKETQTPLEEADRRKWEIQEEIEVRCGSTLRMMWLIFDESKQVTVIMLALVVPSISCRFPASAMEPVKIWGESSEAGTKGGTKATARDETRGETSCREGAEGERTPGDFFKKCLKIFKRQDSPDFPKLRTGLLLSSSAMALKLSPHARSSKRPENKRSSKHKNERSSSVWRRRNAKESCKGRWRRRMPRCLIFAY